MRLNVLFIHLQNVHCLRCVWLSGCGKWLNVSLLHLCKICNGDRNVLGNKKYKEILKCSTEADRKGGDERKSIKMQFGNRLWTNNHCRCDSMVCECD